MHFSDPFSLPKFFIVASSCVKLAKVTSFDAVLDVALVLYPDGLFPFKR